MRRRSRWTTTCLLLAACAGLVAPVLLAVAQGEAPYEALHRGHPGAAVQATTTAMLCTATAASLVVAGVLIHLLFLRDARGHRADQFDAPWELFVLRTASAVWALAAFPLIFLRGLDLSGLPFSRLGDPAALRMVIGVDFGSSAWIVTGVCALIVHFLSWFMTRWSHCLGPAALTLLGTAAPIAVGQTLVGPNHDLGNDTAMLHGAAAAATLGTWAILALRSARAELTPLTTLRRAFVVVTVGTTSMFLLELVLMTFKLAGVTPWQSSTGLLMSLRLVMLAVVLGTCASLLRLWRTGRMRDHRLARRLAVGGLALATWTGATVLMSRIPPPQYFVPTTTEQRILGYDVGPAPTAAGLAGDWRINVLFLVISSIAVIGYLLAVRRVRRRGMQWPLGRTIAWVSGWGTLVLATSSGVGRYSGADFAVHMASHMALSMLAPVLMTLGGPLTLLLKASTADSRRPAGPHSWVKWFINAGISRFLMSPLVAFAIFVGSYYAVYLSSLFENLMFQHWGHQLMMLHFLVSGYLYYSLAVGVDTSSRQLPHIARFGLVLAAMPFHAFFGVILMTSDTVVGRNFYGSLDLTWAALQDAQYVGGGIAWAGGELPLILVMLALGIQWSRSDAREARRKDRHLDRGLDTDFDDYNEMLHRLHEQRAKPPEEHTIEGENPTAAPMGDREDRPAHQPTGGNR